MSRPRDALPATPPQSASSIMLGSWLYDVDREFRRLCQPDARLLSAVQARIMAKETARQAMAAENRAQRFATVLRLANTRKPDEHEAERIQLAYVEALRIRDHLAALLGHEVANGYDAMYRDNASHHRIAWIGTVLIEQGAIKAPPAPVLDEARRMAKR